MFMALSKVGPVFFYPLGFTLLLLAIASLWRGGPSITRAFCFGGFSLLLLASSEPVSQLLLRSLENQYSETAVAALPTTQAIVVLGGGVVRVPAKGRRTVELGNAGDRLVHAVRLLRAGKAPVLLFSGGSMLPDGSHAEFSEARSAGELLKQWNVLDRVVLLETRSRNTRENALFSWQILQCRDIRRITLVTSAFHMPRAAAAFRKVGFAVTTAPADFQSDDNVPSFVWLPDPQALNETHIALKEWLGLFVYRIRGWA